MSDEELLSWYESNKNSKPSDMSDKDYELNMNKAMSLQKQQALQNNFNIQQSQINQQESVARQNASISNQQLMKYLEKYQLSNGVAKGQASSDYIKANNAYNTNLATIANNAQTQRVNLTNTYNSDKLTNEENTYNNQIAILDKYRQLELDEQDRQREEEEWQMQMDAYKTQMDYEAEDRENAKNEALKAEQAESDNYWFSAAQNKIAAIYAANLDKKGNLTSQGKQKINDALEEYRKKFYNEETFTRLLDSYNTTYYVN